MIGWLLRLGTPPPLDLLTDGLLLRAPCRADYAGWLDATTSSEATLRRWQPRWPADHLTEAAFRRRLALFDAERATGSGYAFHLWAPDEAGRIEGAIRLSPVQGGARSAGRLGYWVADRAAGQGLATRAVDAVCAFAFERLGLARVEAAHVPGNAASARVLQKAGFAEEGRARAYVEIDGVRQDHILCARVDDGGRAMRTRPSAPVLARRSGTAGGGGH